MKNKKIILYFILFIIVFLGFNIKNNAQELKIESRICVDTPLEGETKEGNAMNVEGWIMTTDANAKVKIYIDEKDTQAQIQRVVREDVLNIIKGYGGRDTNPLPGFKVQINTKEYSYGPHSLKVVIEDGQGNEIKEKTIQITIDNRIKGRMCVDTPLEGNLKEGNAMNVEGWVMTTDANASVKIYIDGKDAQAQIQRVVREDVLNIIKGYGGRDTNPLPGFKAQINTKEYSYGPHSLKVVIEDGQGNQIKETTIRIIIDNKVKGRMCIDTNLTKNIKENTISIDGWIMCTDINAKIKVYIDGKDTESLINKRLEREDVLKIIKGYGGRDTNPLPGFRINIDLSSYQTGKHQIQFVLLSENQEKIAQIQQNINLKKADFCIDTPNRNKWELKEMPLIGWYLSVDDNAQLKVFINNDEVELKNFVRVEREDVLKLKNGYGGAKNNPKPGFECTIDLSEYNKMEYDVKFVIQSKDGTQIYATETRKIKIDCTPKAKVSIDTPTPYGIENVNGQICGWMMTNIKNPILEIYVDNQLITEPKNRVIREDVIEKIIGYGGIENNPKPGYVINIDFSKYSIGNHSIKAVVKDADDNNRELTSVLQSFKVIEQYKLESGTYGLSGQGRALRYYKIGKGPNVFFATYTVHGFEDSWDYDGQELIYIAEEFKNRLVNEKDFNLLSKWTIYLFPEVNPDGAEAGWSNNGPGRKTLYSWAPGNQGIDLNRCWSTNYKRMTGRNYNGTEPFQAPEAAYLRDFLLANRATNGQTVLVDLHGWTTQLIGDNEICNGYYKSQFPNNKYTSSYGSGYLVNWARSNLGANGRVARSALIELPSAGIHSHQDVLNNNFSGRYIEATLSMLRNL